MNAAGKRASRTYRANEVDVFFIVTGDRQIYVIPFSACGKKKVLALDKVYKNFLVV